MKVFVVLSILVILLGLSCQSSLSPLDDKPVQRANLLFSRTADAAGQLCGVCIQFAGQFINQLLNIVLNAGVVGGCAELCEILAEKAGNQLVGEVCDVLCDIVGIREFIKIIEEADLDPIYYCELLTACPIFDNGDASILSLNVTPTPVPKGSTFNIVMTFKTANGTGTGEIQMLIHTQDGIPLGQSELSKPEPPGTYTVTWHGSAEPDPNCDPSQGPCEMWLPGNYSVEVAVCNGECGSKHPHSQIYDTDSADFTVV